MSGASPQEASIRTTVKEYILREFLRGADAEELKDDTPLVASGILDSLATVRLVAFLEEHFGITVAPHEASADHLGTLDDIAALVKSKKAS